MSSLIYSFVYYFVRLSCFVAYSFSYFSYPSVYLFIDRFINSFVHSFIRSFIHSFIHSFIQRQNTTLHHA